MASDVMELDAVVVEVVEDAQAELVTLAVVGLGNSASGNDKGSHVQRDVQRDVNESIVLKGHLFNFTTQLIDERIVIWQASDSSLSKDLHC